MSKVRKKVLFVCSQNMLRSPTARFIYSRTKGVLPKSAGVDWDITREKVAWADIIFVMEKRHRAKILKLFGPECEHKHIYCLHIQDNYDFLDPRLLEIMPKKLERWLPKAVMPSAEEIAAAHREYVTKVDYPVEPWDGL